MMDRRVSFVWGAEVQGKKKKKKNPAPRGRRLGLEFSHR